MISPSTAASACGSPDEDFALHRLRGFTPLIWFIALAAGLVLSRGPLLDHVDYIKRFGDLAHRLLWYGLGALVVALPLYQWMRARGWWRYELLALAAWPIAFGLVRDPLATLVVLWMFTTCFLVGSYALDKLGLVIEGDAENLALSIAVGTGFLVAVLFALGLAGGYYRWAFVALFSLTCLFGKSRIQRLATLLSGFQRTWRETDELRRPVYGVLIVFAFAFVTVTLFTAFTPTLAYDAKIYHLPSIRFYAAAHALLPVPLMGYSYFPQGTEILQSAAYSLAGQFAAGLITPAAFLLTLLLVYAIVRRAGAGRAATIGAVIIAGSVPFIHWSGSVLKNDLFVALFQAGALYSLLRVWRGGPVNWLKLGAFLLAMSFSIKHVAIFGGLALGLLALVEIQRHTRPWRLAAVCLAVLVVFGTFFHVRTYVLKGSPIYPKAAVAITKRYGPVHRNGLAEQESGRLSYPWMFHFVGRNVFSSDSNNPCGMFLVLCGSVWLFTRRRVRSTSETLCWLFCAIYFLYWGWIWGILRYAILPFLLVFALTGIRFLSFLRQSGPLVRSSGHAALAYSCVFSLLVAVMIHDISFAQVRMLTGRTDEKQYLRTIEAEYPAMEFLSTVARSTDRFIGVRNCARSHLPPLNEFFCAGLADTEAALPRVMRQLDQGDWNYIIVPSAWRQTYLEAIPDTYTATLAYQDQVYSVLALSRRTDR